MIKEYPSAEYIWDVNARPHADQKICFRKRLYSGNKIKKISMDIWADSRYYLWINGEFVGTGPARCWPEYPQKDQYELSVPNPTEEILIAVLVWHFGTSTSQYIHGPAGCWADGTAEDASGVKTYFVTDDNWLCMEHQGYLTPVPRINVSQSWIEMLDDSLFPQDWMQPHFDDSSWKPARQTTAPVASDGEPFVFEKLQERTIPLLTSVTRLPVKLVREQRVLCRGTGIRIDYKEAFYPEDRTTEDRLQSGFICCLMESSEIQGITITLADRIWPETDEFILLNGEKYTFSPGQRAAKLKLKKGENLLLIDISGARQRFTSDLHFLPEHEIAFLSPLRGEDAMFAAVGPFETAAIGNIVCADGFGIDAGNKDYVKAGQCGKVEVLESFRQWLKPVQNTLFDGVKLRSTKAELTLIDSTSKPVPASILLMPSDETGDHEIILDMGVEVSGFLQFTVETSNPVELDFRFFEYLADGIPEVPDDLDTSLRYSCPSGKNNFRSLHRRGFRYIALRARSTSEIMISDLKIDERLYPLMHRARMETGDEVLNRIWEMSRRTVELCSEDTPVDAPAFEQAYWTGDAYVMALYHQYLFGETKLAKHSLLLAARSMNYSQLPDSHLPAGVHLLLTAWAQLWILAVRDYWMHTADRVFIEGIYPWVEKAAKAFATHIDERGLLKIDAWNMLDWAEMDTPYRGTIAHLNAGLSACFKAVAELSKVLGRTENRKKWENSARLIAKNIDAVLWDEGRKCYIDSIHDDGKRSNVISVQTNLMMYTYGCVPEEKEELIKSFIISPPEDAVVPGSPFLAHFYYEFLFSEGLGERALEGIREQWSPMLGQGTCWETFRGFYKDRLTRSYCHAWSSAPAYLFGAYVLGIRPLQPGFGKVLIAPGPSGLLRAAGAVPLPSGDAVVHWAVKDGVFDCRVNLPEKTEWIFSPPEEYRSSSRITVKYLKPQGEA